VADKYLDLRRSVTGTLVPVNPAPETIAAPSPASSAPSAPATAERPGREAQ
jgi:hypothetical protein